MAPNKHLSTVSNRFNVRGYGLLFGELESVDDDEEEEEDEAESTNTRPFSITLDMFDKEVAAFKQGKRTLKHSLKLMGFLSRTRNSTQLVQPGGRGDSSWTIARVRSQDGTEVKKPPSRFRL